MKTVHMGTVTLTIDGQAIEAPEGEKLLFAALDNDIYIPHLCAYREPGTPDASCRLCWVEIEGKPRPVTACTETVTAGMVVNTRGEAALRMARSAMELLLSEPRCGLPPLRQERCLRAAEDRLPSQGELKETALQKDSAQPARG